MNINGIIGALVAVVLSPLATPAAPAAAVDPVPCAQQRDYSLDVGQSMCWAPQPSTIFVVQGPKDMWGLRRVAAYVDRRVERMTIITARGVRCNEPQFLLHDNVFCITVRKRPISSPNSAEEVWGDYMPRGGLFDGTASRGVIRLNSQFDKDDNQAQQWAAGHELLHALGMQHHTRDGHGPYNATGQGMLAESSMATLPSRKEIIALQWWYEFDNTNSR